MMIEENEPSPKPALGISATKIPRGPPPKLPPEFEALRQEALDDIDETLDGPDFTWRPSAYIAGPMSGYPKYNFPAFDEARDALLGMGWNPVSPADHDREVYPDIETWPECQTGEPCPDFDLAATMRWDLQQVIECDRIVLLEGWAASKGTRAELTVARACGKPVYLFHPEEHEDGGKVRIPVYLEFLTGEDIERELRLADCATLRVREPEQFIHATEIGYWPAEPELPSVANLPRLGQDEVRIVDPVSGGEKGQKLARFDLVPVGPLAALATHYGIGARKYADRNWERGYKYSLSYAALLRHLTAWWDGEENDPETGSSHLAAVAFHVFALLFFRQTGRGTDDRPNTYIH